MTEFFMQATTTPMYVQHWRADAAALQKKGPVILIHGGSHTGTGWTTTPDGRPGWAFLFTQAGWDVYVVDWPGVGRSGVHPRNVEDSPVELVDTLQALLKRVGPAALVGHSIGGALAFKLAEREPELVRALAAMAPASTESVRAGSVPAPMGVPTSTPREGAQDRFASSHRFPKEAFDNYFSSLVAYGPKVRNAAVGLTGELRVDPGRREIWGRRVPVLFVAAELDKTVPPDRVEETAKALGVPVLFLERDWKLPGHGHMFVIERETEKIAARVEAWLSQTPTK
ncbi:alpha/beta fold hydrolase [uncultured Pigmentiphaga sp.]|uniref:alpha/beta fold hydrolase n=1 Tax=uncultured Pigmentiphaga sp. TaxID=340361 RepID=UPI002634B431|nr:alpha/beta fold hydrolase [uncultured Pigmentiphaga sp.]